MINDNYFSVNYNDPYCKYEEDMKELKFGFDCKAETKAGLYKGSVGMNYCNYIIGESSYNSHNSKKIEIPTRFEKLTESSIINNEKKDLILTKHGIILKYRSNNMGFYDLLKEFKRGAKLTKEEFHFIETVINRYKHVDSDTARYTISNIIDYMSCNNEIFIHGSSGLINTCIELEPKFINRVYEYYREVLSSENRYLPIRNDIQKITTYNFIKYSLLPVAKKINTSTLISIALSASELFKYEDIPLYIAVNYYKLDKGEIDTLGDDALNILVSSKYLAPYVFLNLSSTKRMKALLSLGISKQLSPELLYANEYLHTNGKSRMVRRVLDIDSTGKIYQYIEWLKN